MPSWLRTERLEYDEASRSHGDFEKVGINALPVTERWNGTSWTPVNAPDPGKAAQLFGAATVNGSIWAVGAYSKTGAGAFLQQPQTLVLQR